MWSNSNVVKFVRETAISFDTNEENVMKMFKEEFKEIESFSIKSDKKDITNQVIDSCKFWLLEDRKTIMPNDLCMYRIGPLFFKSVLPRI